MKKRTVLVVEDHALIRRLVKMMLAIYPLDVIEAVGGRDGVVAFERYHPGLVFLDLMLPDADGMELCRQMKLAAPTARVVILSARGQAADRRRATEAGADGYVIKPFEEIELYQQVEAAFPGIARR